VFLIRCRNVRRTFRLVYSGKKHTVTIKGLNTSTAKVLLRHRWDGVSGLRRRARDNAAALSCRRSRGRFWLICFWHLAFIT
jgi:hypothetical protein